MKRVESNPKSGCWMLDTGYWIPESSIKHRISSVVLLLLIMSMSSFSYAQDIYVHSNEGGTVGELFTVDVMVRNIVDLSTFEFCISFNKDILEAVGVVKGSLWGNPGYLWNTGEIDNTSGVISFISGAAYSGSSPSGVSVDANGDVLATITFGAISAGISPVNLTDVLAYNVNGHSISINIVSGDVIVNTLPSASNLSISPISPLTTDDLLGSYTYTDADNDPEGNTEVRWYKDGVLQTAYNDTLTVPSSATSSGEGWYFTVKPYDGKDYGALQTSPIVMIGNTSPTATDLSIAPASPFTISSTSLSTTDDLLGSYTYSDIDNDPEGNTEVRWYRDGVLQTAYNDTLTVPSSATSSGEEWYFTVKPYDGKDYGALQTSPTVTICNTAPTATDLSVAPSSPLTTDDLTGSYTYTDVDSDPEGNTEVRWYKDGIPQTAYNDTLTVLSSDTSKGEQWCFTVTPSDGTSFGELQTSGSVAIGNTVPVASNLGITPVSPKTDDDLVGSYDYSDADGDPESGSEIRWYKNDILQTAYNDLLIVPPSAVSNGDKWYFTARPCDGTDYGTLQVSPIVTIQNSSPTAEAGGPYSGEEGSPVTFDGSGSSHPDGAMVSYQWDFGDGTSGAEGVTASHVYADNGTYTVTLTVTDSDGDTDTDTATVTIENVAPTGVDAGLDQTVNEGDAVSFSGSFSDPGSGDTHTIEWDFGDGSSKISGTLTPTHTYADDGTYTVTLTVTDDDGGVGTDVSLVTVKNIAPNAEAGGPYSGVAGESITFTGSGTDPGADTLTYSWDFGDGSSAETGQIVSHIYSASGTYTATLTVTDGDGGEHTDAAEVTINPAAAPTAYVNVDMSLRNFGRYWQVTTTVKVRDKDAYGSPIGRAKVYGHWGGAYSGSVSGETRKNGNVSFNTGWLKTPGTVTFTVDNVIKGGQEYALSGVISCSISKSPGAEEEFVLAQNYPNPSNPGTWIPFAIAKDCQVTIKIYNVTGKLVRTLDLGYLDAGAYIDKGESAYWDGKDENGEKVSSAVYFYVMEAGEYRAMRKMLIAK